MHVQSDMWKQRQIEDEKQVQNVRLIFRNLRMKIRKLHIRYEDDYYQAAFGKKFAFGVTARELSVQTGQDEWKFKAEIGRRN